MSESDRSRFRRLLLSWIAISAVGFVLAGLVAGGAALGQSSGDRFTGCLKDGKITRVAFGSAPLSPCASGETQISWNAQGSPGADGATWFSGATVPEAGLGVNGDLFLHLPSGDVFVKEEGTWVTQANLGGSQGPEGPPGPPGPPGAGGLFFHTGEAVQLSHQLTTVLRLEVPDGTYGNWVVRVELFWEVEPGLDPQQACPDDIGLEPCLTGAVVCSGFGDAFFVGMEDPLADHFTRTVERNDFILIASGGDGLSISCQITTAPQGPLVAVVRNSLISANAATVLP